MRVRRLVIENFRGVRHGVIDFSAHTLLVGGNNIGKSTICEALDLVLSPERGSRHPLINEHDFYKGEYFPTDDETPEIRISVIMGDLSEEEQRRIGWGHLRAWDDEQCIFVDENKEGLDRVDELGVSMVLPLVFVGRYEREEDDFFAGTFFAHPEPSEDVSEEDKAKLGGGLSQFSRSMKRLCGFVFLRALRTGSRALSLQRGSLLDTILRLSEEGSAEMWAATLQKLRDLDPAIGDIKQLNAVLSELRTRMGQFVNLSSGEHSTAFFASDLTRDHLREVVRLFIATEPSGYLVPFNKQGTGTLNMLVFALLTVIADLKGNQSVVFAMEEPEVALPPHTQRLVTKHVLQRMGQAIVTSHSPYVIEQFSPEDIVVLTREGQSLTGNPVDTDLIRTKLYWNAKKEFAEAILSRAVLIVEGIAEVAAFHAASQKLEEFHNGDYRSLDMAGVSVFDAGNDTSVPLFGPIFEAMGKAVYGLWDKPKMVLPEDACACLPSFTAFWESPEMGLENLLLAQCPIAVVKRFLGVVEKRRDYPKKAGKVSADMTDDDVLKLALEVLKGRKGDGYAAVLVQQCETEDELPALISEVLLRVNMDMSPMIETDPAET